VCLGGSSGFLRQALEVGLPLECPILFRMRVCHYKAVQRKALTVAQVYDLKALMGSLDRSLLLECLLSLYLSDLLS
jgi:hypothetical protein